MRATSATQSGGGQNYGGPGGVRVRSVKRVLLACLSAGEAMGQQRYESEILAALRMPAEAAGLAIRPWAVRSLRSDLPGHRRLPVSVLSGRGARAQRWAGRLAYPAADLVHRLDLRLTPAPREVVTVHDLAPLRFPDEGPFPKGVAEGLRRALAVICPSRASADEVATEFDIPTPVVIHNGLSDDVWGARPLNDAQRAHTGVLGRFVLHSGGSTQRKNLTSLAEAWSAVHEKVTDAQLVLTGPTSPRRSALFAGLPAVRMLGMVPRPLLLSLMRSADAVVVPSTYEGFGFPALEAMACGTPVVAAQCSSLPEVCGDAALLVAPTGEGLAQGLLQVLTEVRLADELGNRGPGQARRFDWPSAAVKHVAVYADALQGA